MTVDKYACNLTRAIDVDMRRDSRTIDIDTIQMAAG
jgi:hypothetical protein